MNNAADVILTGGAANNYFGISVSDAGDVNGDGYSDVLAGAYGYSSFTGRAYIYFGGVSMDNVADVTFTGESSNNYFGLSVSSAGDLNGDGYSDIVTGAKRYNSYTGKAYVYFGSSSMDNTADLTLTGETTSNFFGESVSTAEDVNGDGYSDLIIGASSYGGGNGRVYLYYGGSAMNNTADVTFTGTTLTNFGNSVSNAGDVNGDGYSDIIAGEKNAYNSATGRAYIYFGGTAMNNSADQILTGEASSNYFGASVSDAGDMNGDGYSDVITGAYGFNSNTGNMDNIADVSLAGEASGNRFGNSVSKAGDVNGDGYSDVIIGAWGYSSAKGRAYLFYGGTSMNNTADIILTGVNTNDYFGAGVSGAGDVNGDGFSDVIVGSEGFSSSTGRAYIFYGGAVMNNSADVTMNGDSAQNFFGGSVSSAGDVNGDGYSDVIVGAHGYRANTGKAYVYFGGEIMNSTSDVIFTGESADDNFGWSVSTAGDVNGDGFSDVIAGAHRAASGSGRAYIFYGGLVMNIYPDVVLTGELPLTYTYGISVSNAGDINRDGYSDVIVGASNYNTNTGQAFIYYGGSFMNNVPDITITGEGINTSFGNSISSAGDLNGDGNPDLIIGARQTNSLAGKSFIYFTSSPNVHPNILSVNDVADDQGGYINLKFARSAFDVPLSETGGINYQIERSAPPNVNGYQWISVATVSGTRNTFYTAEVHTPLDSGISGNNTYFLELQQYQTLQAQYGVPIF
ncbi:MAG: FG-GAP repeat protein [Ignavibacteria bacterium]|nr:FG-GAP repeat protein [Ignavibacteria bacterium]